ncbi:hypothetical protein FLK61_39315 [Paenalkalicoccus suaedae]|uniref:Uncharacterized protein n=1 Tax=Paenalkalicoccus suaedae TaxID=2592382 RepID=A0A859FJA5_9BACI|nr:hypothetical protein [Paenalkalicoccus suaedae]QKS72665.1 hypothetical protein FLK61_39315 [Paenalkalicoccus suaedae]
MKKHLILSLGAVLTLAACGNNETNGDPINNENAGHTPAGQNESGANNSPANDESDINENNNEDIMNENENEESSASTPSGLIDENRDHDPQEIVENAIALFDDLESLHFTLESEINQQMDMEGMPEGEINMYITETHWEFIQDGEYYNRLEVEALSEGTEDGEEFTEEEPMNYSFTYLDDPTYQITYDEGDTEAIRFEQPIEQEESVDFSQWAFQLEDILMNAELTYEGTEEINGYDTYHVRAEMDGEVSEHWFDQDTYYEVQTVTSSEAGEESPGDQTTISTVTDYELDPDFDESLFEAPEDVEVVDGSFEDTIG